MKLYELYHRLALYLETGHISQVKRRRERGNEKIGKGRGKREEEKQNEERGKKEIKQEKDTTTCHLKLQ